MESNINLGLQGELASFLISPPRFLCLSDQHFVDYRGKLESIMEPSSVPTLGFSLSVFIFSWKPSDQGSVGCSPERILPDKKNHEACPKILHCKIVYAITEWSSFVFLYKFIKSLKYYIFTSVKLLSFTYARLANCEV